MIKRGEKLYLKDMVDAINNIEKYTKWISFKQFSRDHMVVDAVVRNFEIIGEAAKHVSRETKSHYPQIPWREIAGMRDKMIHEYFGVEIDIVWETIEKSLPELRETLVKLLKQL